MGSPAIENRTPFAVELLFPTDEEGRPLCVPVVQATYHILSGGRLIPLEQPRPVNVGGEWWGDPARASVKYEPVFAFVKPATDVVLIGHAYAPVPGTTEMQVGIRIGRVQKLVSVFGKRVLYRCSGKIAVSPPGPVDRIPLVYERAFGGWDRRHPNPSEHRFEPRNPVGLGFRHRTLGGDDELELPNLEDPVHPFRTYGDAPPPAGFGFLGPHWPPRVAFAGTYDAAWDRERKPLLPRDFDRRFFNAASPGLVAPAYLQGDEPVVVIGASPEGRVAFQLPEVRPPMCQVERRGRSPIPLTTALDTVIVDMAERVLLLMWRTHVPLRHGPHDVVAVKVRVDAAVAASGGR